MVQKEVYANVRALKVRAVRKHYCDGAITGQVFSIYCSEGENWE